MAIVATTLRTSQYDRFFYTVTWQDIMTSILNPILNEENRPTRTETHSLIFWLPIFCNYLYFNWNPEIVLFFNSTVLF